MKDFQTKQSEVLLKDVQVNGQDIYLNLSSANVMDIARYSKKENLEDVDIIMEVAKLILTPKSFELVSLLDLEQFYTVLDLAQAVYDEQKETLSQRFCRAE